MFASGISSFTRTWMNLGCQKRLQSTSAMTYHASCTYRDTSYDIEDRDRIPRPLCMGIKFPIPGKVKTVKCPGYARGGMLKLRFDRYISRRNVAICTSSDYIVRQTIIHLLLLYQPLSRHEQIYFSLLTLSVKIRNANNVVGNVLKCRG